MGYRLVLFFSNADIQLPSMLEGEWMVVFSGSEMTQVTISHGYPHDESETSNWGIPPKIKFWEGAQLTHMISDLSLLSFVIYWY